MVLYKFLKYRASIDVAYPYIHFDDVFPCPRLYAFMISSLICDRK